MLKVKIHSFNSESKNVNSTERKDCSLVFTIILSNAGDSNKYLLSWWQRNNIFSVFSLFGYRQVMTFGSQLLACWVPSTWTKTDTFTSSLPRGKIKFGSSCTLWSRRNFRQQVNPGLTHSLWKSSPKPSFKQQNPTPRLTPPLNCIFCTSEQGNGELVKMPLPVQFQGQQLQKITYSHKGQQGAALQQRCLGHTEVRSTGQRSGLHQHRSSGLPLTVPPSHEDVTIRPSSEAVQEVQISKPQPPVIPEQKGYEWLQGCSSTFFKVLFTQTAKHLIIIISL